MYLLDTNIWLERLLEQERAEDMHRLVEVMNAFNLDFDDAYQYVAAEVYEAILVSFDGDFDHTKRGRSAPAELLDTDEHEDSPPNPQNPDSESNIR